VSILVIYGQAGFLSAAEDPLDGITWITLTSASNHVFNLSVDPITCEQYSRFLKATKRTAPKGTVPTPGSSVPFRWEDFAAPKGYEKWPVAYITKDDATAYCNWLGTVTHNKFRLPNKAELEYAFAGAWRSRGGVEIDRMTVWWGLDPADGDDRRKSKVGVRCFPHALDEWTTDNWNVSGSTGHASNGTETSFVYMQGPGRRLEVTGFRVVIELE